MQEFAPEIAGRLNIQAKQAIAVLDLLEEGSTIPFIARYRKDKTGALDEVVIQKIQDEAKTLKEFKERKEFISKTITDQGKMTETLTAKINKATTVAELEDIYLPYKPKRKTKAQTARENGLEPFAQMILEQKNFDLESEASKYLNEKVKTAEESLQGSRDIIAELISEDANLRASLRKLFETKAYLISKLVPAKESEGAKFKDYFEYSEQVSKVPSHRALAVLRGFVEGVLRISIEPEEELAIELIERAFLKSKNSSGQQVQKAIKDSYKRLLQPGLESEFRADLKQKSDEEAINVFAENLRQLLLSSPLGNKRVLAIDPGYRTGCKTVCLDEKGDLVFTTVVYIHEPGKLPDTERVLRNCVSQFKIESIAIGDGTAGRETEKLVRKLEFGLPIFMVNEDGASIYSASEIAREEFPNQDVTVRGAVSIGRRLMDPLAELVKIDPKSIGVGQYQHDVNQFRLKEKLDQTVISCVNLVGVNLNTASKHLLSYVSGIGTGLADNIIKHRSSIGKFSNRKELLTVPRLGLKAYEQCAGFLRIKDGEESLDRSGVHPESYPVVERMAADLGADIKTLVGNDELIRKINAKNYVSTETGEHTVMDILKELSKPGLDPRSEAQTFEFAEIFAIEDLKKGMIVPGIVTNLTRFGAFVDIGVKQDGLVHISEISHKYIQDPGEVLKLNDKVMVAIMEVDEARKRISLSIKQATEPPADHKKTGPINRPNKDNKIAPKTSDAPLSMSDALSLLKKKFGK